MATPVPDGPSKGGTQRAALAAWRRIRAGLAAILVVVGALWLALIPILRGSWGPLTINFLTSIVVLLFILWVVVDALVREMTKRAGLGGRG